MFIRNFSSVLVLLSSSAHAADLSIGSDVWRIPTDGGPLAAQTAQVGDTITFDWTNIHDVWIHPSGTCDVTDRIEVGTAPPAVYTVAAGDAGMDLTFSCDVFDLAHCNAGMLMNVYVGKEIAIDSSVWQIPGDGGPLPPITGVRVGDTLTFDWTGTHDVHIHPVNTCDQANRIVVGTSPGASYTVQEADAGSDIFFACDVFSGAHCNNGMIMTVSVLPLVTDETMTDMPTPSPVSMGATSSPTVGGTSGGFAIQTAGILGAVALVAATIML